MPASPMMVMSSEELVEVRVQKAPESEWRKAQRSSCINSNLDLFSAAIAQLRFLKLVDSTPALQNTEVLERAVDRYFENWLPLVSEFLDSPDCNNSLNCYLQPPLDCAWIWHCHKLNPVQYSNDCQNIFKKLLDVKSLPGKEPPDSKLREWADNFSRKKWQTAFPDEPYDFVQEFEDGNGPEFQELLAKKRSNRINPGRLRYDLIKAAERQAPFYYQVSSRWFWDQRFLETALRRYKGFLYLIKKSQEKPGRRPFLVPTYDIDLLWHSHQLAPSAYTNDMKLFLGRVLDHDDKDSDRSAGQRLNTGFEETCDLWLKTYGKVYEQAGGMFRGPAPLPAPPIPILTEEEENRLLSFTKKGRWNTAPFNTNLTIERITLKLDDVDARSVMQVNVIVLGGKNVPKSSDPTTINQAYVRVTALAKCPILDVRTRMKQLEKQYDEVEWNEGLCLEMESATQGLRLQLMRSKFRLRRPEKKANGRGIGCFGGSRSRRNTDNDLAEEAILDPYGTDEVIGQLDISWSELLRSKSGLAITKWVPIYYARYGPQSSAPVPQLRYHVSITPPVPASKIFRCVQSPVTDDNCQTVTLRLRDAPGMRPKVPQVGRWITKIVVNHLGTEKFVVRTRSKETFKASGTATPVSKESVDDSDSETLIQVHNGGYKEFKHGKILGSARQLMKADFHVQNKDNVRYWSLFDDGAILAVHRPTANRGFKLKIYGELGSYRMRLIPGARLQFEEPNDSQMTSSVTLVRYTPDSPLGAATALINLKTASIAVMPGESVVLVLLISGAIYKSFYDFDAKLAVDPTISWRVNNTTLPKLGTSTSSENSDGGSMGSVVLHNRGLSSRWSMMYPREERPKILYDRWHLNCGHEMAGTLCSAAGCSGATCGGNTCGVVSGSACGASRPASRGGSVGGDYSAADLGNFEIMGFGYEGRG